MLSSKTYEYALTVNASELAQFDVWQLEANRLWNAALEALLHLQYWRRREPCLTDEPLPAAFIERRKIGDDWVDSCAIVRDFRIDKTKSWDKDNIATYPCCNIVPQSWLVPPTIENFTFFSVKKAFTKARFDSGSLPSIYVDDVVETLCESWQQYQKGVRGKPRFKGKRNAVSSFGGSFRHHCGLDGQTYRLPRWGRRSIPQHLQIAIARAKAAIERDPLSVAKVAQAIQPPEGKKKALKQQLTLAEAADLYSLPGAFRLIRREHEFFLQCSVYAPSKPTGQRDTAIIRCGADYLYTTGCIAIPHLDSQALQRRLEVLRQVLSSKTYGSANWVKVKNKIKALERRVSKRRRRWQQYHAQWLTDRYSQITIEKVKVEESLGTPIPIAKDGEYLPNGATVEAERNREVLSAAIGQFISLIQQQGKTRDCVIAIVDPPAPKPKVEPVIVIQPLPKRAAKLPRRNRKKERAIG